MAAIAAPAQVCTMESSLVVTPVATSAHSTIACTVCDHSDAPGLTRAGSVGREHSSQATMPPQAIPAPRPGTKEELPNIANLAVTPGGAHFLGTTPGGERQSPHRRNSV